MVDTDTKTISSFYDELPVDISVNILGKKFINPYILAATPSSDEEDMLERAFDLGWAGAVLKTTNKKGVKDDLAYPLMSGPFDRYVGSEMLANIDLTSAYSMEDIEKRSYTLKKKYSDRIIIVGISGANKSEWQELAKRAANAGADFIECSFSCPQGSLGLKPGQMLGQNVDASKEVVSWIQEGAGNTPVVIKLTPQVEDVALIAKAVIESGADAVCLGNSLPGIIGIDSERFVPLPNVQGFGTTAGISGSAVKPVALRSVALAAKENIKIFASGGVITWHDALEFILLGANVVEYGTATMYYGFDIIDDLTSGLKSYLYNKKIKSLDEVRGQALKNFVGHDKLEKCRKVRPNIDLERCVGDGACLIACRDGGHQAITFSEDRKPMIDDDKCIGCGFCSSVCPLRGCIVMEDKSE